MAHTQAQVAEQYKTSANLDARSALHERFSTNPERWMRWVFDQFELPAHAPALVLELGCGPGWLWAENIARLPAAWDVTLSDQSPGMLGAARQNLGVHASRFRLACLDATNLPFNASVFEAVIANHMLYHVPKLNQTLAEIRRVLAPRGVLYAATNGIEHMRELRDLAQQFYPAWRPDDAIHTAFSLQDTPKLLAHFESVELRQRTNILAVTEGLPIAAYLLSSVRADEIVQRRDQLLGFIEDKRLAAGGVINIHTKSGLFIARKARGEA